MVKLSKFQRNESSYIVDTATSMYQEIHDGEYDKSGTRHVIDGSLFQLNYGQVAGIYVNKANELEAYLYGNNFLTTYDQYWDSSQIGQWMARENDRAYATEKIKSVGYKLLPQDLIAQSEGRDIRFCGGEPAVNADYLADISESLDDIKLIIETNGTLSDELIEAIQPAVKKYIVKLDSPDNEFFIKHHKTTVNYTIEGISRLLSTETQVSVTTLLIPGENTETNLLLRLLDLIGSLGINSWEIQKFVPSYRVMDKPETSLQEIDEAMNLAIKKGFDVKLKD